MALQVQRGAYCELWKAIFQSLLPHFAEDAISTNNKLGIDGGTSCEMHRNVIMMLF